MATCHNHPSNLTGFMGAMLDTWLIVESANGRVLGDGEGNDVTGWLKLMTRSVAADEVGSDKNGRQIRTAHHCV